jgi:[ribosomal protein S5]-alanine N-acetyltransferase
VRTGLDPGGRPSCASIPGVVTRIETPRLIIRTLEAGDAEAWLAMVNDPAVTRFLPPRPPSTMETFQESLERRQAMERKIGYAMWAVDDKATGTFIGQCGIRLIEEDGGPETELAYHYTRSSWNRGYGTEAAIAVLAHGLGPLGVDRIMAVVVPENTGSVRILEKAGMRYEGQGNYFGLEDLKKYAAERAWWTPPPGRPG